MGKAAKKKKFLQKNGIPKVDTSKPSAAPVAHGGRNYTVSIALPGSIIANAQRLEWKTNLAGQIGRALAVFCVDEVIVYDDGTVPAEDQGGISEPNAFLRHVLQFLETPPYLRTQLFPMHPDLRHAALLKSMDLPHHLKIDDHLPYREGIALPPSAAKVQGTLVDVGLGTVHLPTDQIEPYTRVTIDMSAVSQTPSTGTHITNAKLAKSTDPTTKMGYYWGYATRQASSLSAVITESPFAKGYDVVIGTSERGEPVEQIRSSLPPFAHLLVVFGGQAGIEAAASNDPELKKIGGDGIGDLFDWWVNAVPGQGSRTIRTEEAIWIVLGQMFSEFQRKGIK